MDRGGFEPVPADMEREARSSQDQCIIRVIKSPELHVFGTLVQILICPGHGNHLGVTSSNETPASGLNIFHLLSKRDFFSSQNVKKKTHTLLEQNYILCI